MSPIKLVTIKAEPYNDFKTKMKITKDNKDAEIEIFEDFIYIERKRYEM